MAGKYYGVKRSDAFLAHYGILGMKWGVTRSPEQLGHMKIPKNASHRNLEKFGKTPDTNVCYIMGTSGSGKSTVARNSMNKRTNVIHLDAYIDGTGAPKSKDFNSFLLKNGINHKDVTSFVKNGQWDKVDDFTDLIDKFGADQYRKKKRVICEGVQLMDNTLHPDKEYFKSKPHVILNTSYVMSYLRGHRRDGMKIKLSDIKTIRNNRKILKQLKTKLGY